MYKIYTVIYESRHSFGSQNQPNTEASLKVKNSTAPIKIIHLKKEDLQGLVTLEVSRKLCC